MVSTLAGEDPALGTRSPKTSPLGDAGRFLAGRLRQIGIFLALLVIVTLFQVLTGGALLQPDNVSNIIVQNSYILLLAIGMVMIIVAGHIDLSVGSVAAFVGAMSGIMIRDWGMPWWAALVASLAVGALVGAWQGFWVAYVGIPAFIVTLAGMLVFRGLTQIILGNQRITGFPEEYRQLGGGSLFPGLFPPETNLLDWTTVGLGVLATALLVISQLRGRAARTKLNLDDEPRAWFFTRLAFSAAILLGLTYLLASSRGGTPIVLVVLGILVIAYSAVMNRSVFGRHVYARGGNLQAAHLSGVNTKRVDFLLFVNMGVLAALAGLIFTGRLNSAGPGAGNLFELDAIAAAFIGGAAVTGGVGTIVGAITGGLIMGVLNNGMSLLGVGIDYQQFIKGLVLLLAVGFDVFNKRKASNALK
ncbi:MULTISPECIES: multiple monosaccharide ABC transporter permease [unclassified Arthrobacter]|uniref:multiple monosaccharide ABC transporter permease n=1 Tax=unclassified Arthrobacter TaxID=235627 RepID=UPI001E2D67F3|nr:MULTISPECIES: multiple monosaccharide ABC transporter permease [unclassified Arthrobacter]MCC9144321.1 sugar ABC transporter permease [Arthrobacter sp. zg-Y919]MDK1275547.1 sugar ABC transporter permease [Arthrobacter sp. zg.Y919]MDM7991179.1 sugar ABC transporter permease [Arthrobacter sp. zg-Y877]WIB03078.1 sugar ABC transporter permease [Arthrobacter sp. zg-Y919]